MAQRKPDENVTLDQVLKLVEFLTPADRSTLRSKLDDKNWGDQWRALCNEVDEQNKNTPPLSEDEIVAEMKAVRKELKAKSAQSGN
jgi:hypothetical protein